jgi:uncharacterized protein
MKLTVLSKKESKEDPWYADGLSFTCTQCGNCCTGGPGYVWISDIEIDRLAEFLKLTREETLELHCRKIGGKYSLNEHCTPADLYDCTFLKEVKTTSKSSDGQTITHTKRTCTIYPVRPLQCRTWPFWEGNLASKQIWDSASKRCPGMDTGRKYSKQQIEALRDAEDWPEKSPTS